MATLTAITVLAQDTTPAPSAAPTSPAPSAVSPAAQTQPEAAPEAPRRKHASVRKRVVLDPPGTATVKGEVVNVRGQPDFTGEVLGHLQKGESVTVLAEISLNHPAADEPAHWSEISMPTNIVVWVDGDYVDTATQMVKARRVNMRGGPGENYSVVGRLEKGAPVIATETKNGWIAIAPPTNAYAFVASDLLEAQAAGAPAPAAATPEVVNVAPGATPAAATNEPTAATNEAAAAPVAPAPTPQSEVDQELAVLRGSNAPATAAAPAPEAATPPAAAPEPITPRVVAREGFVHKAYNIQAPADYELHDVQTGRIIDYLQPPADEKFEIYVGTRVMVNGPEFLDQRWPRTPVLQVQNVQLMP
jgi:SH3-like domain-containing protein